MELKGTQTEMNIKAALAGESIARNKYSYFADRARKDGILELAEMYERLAKNEATHAKIWYTSLYGAIPGNLENLKAAAGGEFEEWSRMYPNFAKTAREEGFEDLAAMFEHVADIEKDHERQFMEAIIQHSKQLKAASEQKDQAVPPPPPSAQKRDGYRCVFCGATFEHRPDVCPVCQAIGAFEECKISV